MRDIWDQISGHLDSLRLWLVAAMTAILTPFWAWVTAHWAGFWWSNPLCWLAVFWAADFVLGYSRAAYEGLAHPNQPEFGVDKHKILLSFRKLAGYVAGLMIAWGLRDGLGVGGDAVASAAEVAILVYEASSVMGHVGAITGLPIFNFIANKGRRLTGGNSQ